MKKAAAILLLAIFTFNIFGYRLLYTYLSDNADTTLETVLDEEQYDEADLISIKEPTNMPYYTNSKNFQRINGEVKSNGIIYKYVKYRIYNDSLEMLCIPNVAKMHILNSRDEFFKLANDFQQAGCKKKNHTENKQIKPLITDCEILYNEAAPAYSTIEKKMYAPFVLIKQKNCICCNEQPPDMGAYLLS